MVVVAQQPPNPNPNPNADPKCLQTSTAGCCTQALTPFGGLREAMILIGQLCVS